MVLPRGNAVICTRHPKGLNPPQMYPAYLRWQLFVTDISRDSCYKITSCVIATLHNQTNIGNTNYVGHSLYILENQSIHMSLSEICLSLSHNVQSILYCILHGAGLVGWSLLHIHLQEFSLKANLWITDCLCSWSVLTCDMECIHVLFQSSGAMSARSLQRLPIIPVHSEYKPSTHIRKWVTVFQLPEVGIGVLVHGMYLRGYAYPIYSCLVVLVSMSVIFKATVFCWQYCLLY